MGLDIQSMDISIRHPRFYAIYFIDNGILKPYPRYFDSLPIKYQSPLVLNSELSNTAIEYLMGLDIQSMDISIRHPRFYAIYFIENHIFPKNYCKVIPQRMLIIFALEEADIFRLIF
jgi:hypothetical protein